MQGRSHIGPRSRRNRASVEERRRQISKVPSYRGQAKLRIPAKGDQADSSGRAENVVSSAAPYRAIPHQRAENQIRALVEALSRPPTSERRREASNLAF